MAKKKVLKIHTEAEIIQTFNLNRRYEPSELLLDWVSHCETQLNNFESIVFEKILQRAKRAIDYWSEEDVKMHFITHIVELADLMPTDTIGAFFGKKMEADVQEHHLTCKPDFTIAKSVMDLVQRPYFHFHEYKKDKASTRDPLGQLLKAFLIGATINANNKPLYGAYITGRFWYFVIYENNKTFDYSVSPAYDSTKEVELMKIIAILRRFKIILQTTLLD